MPMKQNNKNKNKSMIVVKCLEGRYHKVRTVWEQMRSDILEELRIPSNIFVREHFFFFFNKRVSFPRGHLKLRTTNKTITTELRQLKGLDNKKEWHCKYKWTKFSNWKTEWLNRLEKKKKETRPNYMLPTWDSLHV